MLPLIAVTALGLAAADDLLDMLGEQLRVTIKWEDHGLFRQGYIVKIYVGEKWVGTGSFYSISNRDVPVVLIKASAEAIARSVRGTRLYTWQEMTKAVAAHIRTQELAGANDGTGRKLLAIHGTASEIERSILEHIDHDIIEHGLLFSPYG